MTPNPTGIEQINLGYHDQEDRLLLKLGLLDKTELAVWLSRRVTKAVWSLLHGDVAEPIKQAKTDTTKTLIADNKAKALESFAQEVKSQKSIENMDFRADYDANRQTLTETALLAVQAMMITTEQSQTHLELQCKNGQAIKIALNQEIIHAITNMMQLATREAGWDLALNTETAQLKTNNPHVVLH